MTKSDPSSDPPDADPSRAQRLIIAALDRPDLDQWDVTPMPGTMTISRHWPDGTVDTVILLSPGTAYGHRRNSRDETVWTFKGTLDNTITAALSLAPPPSPEAPSDPLPERPEPVL